MAWTRDTDSPFSRFDPTKNLGGAYNLTDSASGRVFHPDKATGAFSVIRIDTVYHHNRPWSMTVPTSLTNSTTADRGKIPHTGYDANLRV
jgi:hypothetical protein